MIAPKGHVIPRSWGGTAVDKRLWYLIAGTRGGANRARILWTLHERPRNANDLAGALGLDYKTVRHHLEILRENDCVMALGGEGYGMLYNLSPHLQTHFDDFLRIWERFTNPSDVGKVRNSHGPMEVAR
jgi:DNA-binding transcriptional ArsR family regulator